MTNLAPVLEKVMYSASSITMPTWSYSPPPFWVTMLPAALVNSFVSKFKSSSVGCPSIFVISYFSLFDVVTNAHGEMLVLVTNESIPKGFSYDC